MNVCFLLQLLIDDSKFFIMEKFNKKKNDEFVDNDNVNASENADAVENYDVPEEDIEVVDESRDDVSEPVDEIESLKSQLEAQKKDYLFLMADFDNFRKRTLKEKSELIKNGGEQALKGLLPIVDDFERGIKASENSEDANAVLEGMKLIYNKFIKYLASNGVKEFDPEDREFNPERHEAISVVPVEDEAQKGKILDTVEKGYMLNDKVLRHAKVVVGQ